jgi:hypothetical protein
MPRAEFNQIPVFSIVLLRWSEFATKELVSDASRRLYIQAVGRRFAARRGPDPDRLDVCARALAQPLRTRFSGLVERRLATECSLAAAG